MAHPLVADSLSWTGFLDKTLAIFEQNNQPFILVGMLAKWWSGCRHDPGPEIDVLVRSSILSKIVGELTACD